MRITEDTAKVLAVSSLIAQEKRTTLIRDTILFAALCITDTPAKDIISENVQETSLILERLGMDLDIELDDAAIKMLADRAFQSLRIDVRKIFQNASDLSRRTGFKGAVNPEHLLFVIMSRRVSNHPEIFNSLEAAGADVEGIKNSIISIFNEQADAAREDNSMDGNDDPGFGANDGPVKPTGKPTGKGVYIWRGKKYSVK